MRLIDADMALEALIEKGQASRRYKLGEIWELNGQEIREVLNALPPAQPEQPTEVQDILQYLDEYLHPIVSPEHWSVYSELYDMVSMLQSSQPEQRWIPCSERLPEESGYYIIAAHDGVGHRTTFVKYQKKAKSWNLTGARSYWRVIAWMPLPEPYEERRER